MSNRYKGGIISATPPTTTGGNDGVASGAWTLEQQMQAQAAGLWPNQPIFYIEDVFSTYLYAGNNSSQTITNGINLSGKGGLVWIKNRTSSGGQNTLFDTARGVNKYLNTNDTIAETTDAGMNFSFLSTGFSQNNLYTDTNASGSNYVSWTFRKQPKFFDVVTWTGNGSADQTITHTLGSTPGFITVKKTSGVSTWWCFHGSLGNTSAMELNSTSNVFTTASINWAVTSTTFNAEGFLNLNDSASTYVAYIFAHNSAGFGLTGTDNVISCGSYTGNGSATGPVVTLGYEPQLLWVKRTDSAGSWSILDNMRGLPTGSADAQLLINSSNAESSTTDFVSLSATGFQLVTTSTAFNASGGTYIYISIRRGPMKVPTVGTTVFSPVARTGTGATANITAGFTVDLEISKTRPIANPPAWFDRLRGRYRWLRSNDTTSEATLTNSLTGFDNNTGVVVGSDVDDGIINFNARTYGNWMFGRAPGFFDVVCYAGTGSATTVTHNLAAVPELIIVKSRNGAAEDWRVYYGVNQSMALNTTAAGGTASPVLWNDTAPTSSVFSVGTSTNTNGSGYTYVAYLFATCAGVSKVGSYTGTGAAQTINCGFTAGSRFVMIKRTDSTGDWYVWDSARGIIPANDPYLLLNSTAAETTGTDYVDATNVGFDITSTAPAAINANGGTFIFLAIA